jgi:DNA-binding MarR family transcriptional regulator
MARLDAERLALWRQLRRMAATIDAELDADLRAEVGLDRTSFETLAYLAEHEGRARMTEIAASLVVNASTFTRVVDRLDARGLVTRELTTDDGRGVIATLTRKGERTFVRSRPVYRRAVQRLFNRYLTDSDLTALHRVLNKTAETP